MVNRRVVRLNLRKVNQVCLAVVDGRGRVHASGVATSSDGVVFLSCLRGLRNWCRDDVRGIVRSCLIRSRHTQIAIRRAARRKS